MNAPMRKLTAVMLAAAVLSAALAGCNRGSPSDVDEAEYVYVSQRVPLPRDIGEISNLAYYAGKAYFVAVKNDPPSAENLFLSSAEVGIFSINIDGTELAKLDGYAPAMERLEGTGGMVSIDKLTIDSEGFIWVVERGDFYVPHLPEDFDIDGEDPWWEHIEPIESGVMVRKLDAAGAELFSMDISGICTNAYNESKQVRAFAVGMSDFIYLCLEDNRSPACDICVLDNPETIQFRLDTQSRFGQFVQMPDGAIAFPIDGGSLQTIKTSGNAVGEVIKLPDIDRPAGDARIFTGEEYDILISDSNGLYGYVFGQETLTWLLDWQDIGVPFGRIGNIAAASDNRLVCLSTEHSGTQSRSELIVLTRTLRSELPEKAVLTLAVFNLSPHISNAVAEFNATNRDYLIEIKAYSEYSGPDDWGAGERQFIIDMNAGIVPDIVEATMFPYADYAANGILADLYPFIDADPDFERGDFVRAAMLSAEVDGGLYMISPNFYIFTIVGHPSVVGADTGWNIEEFQAVLDAHPDADIPIVTFMSKSIFLQSALHVSIDDYIDWDAGTARFDTPEFIQLLEFTDNLPLESGGAPLDPPNAPIPAGRQIMQIAAVFNFHAPQLSGELFGGEIAYKGFPSGSRNGHSLWMLEGLSIVEASVHKEAAWEFLRGFLDKDWQIDYISSENRMFFSPDFGFATNQAAFDQRLQAALEMDINGVYFGDVLYQRPSQQDIDTVLAIIDSATGMARRTYDTALWDIINESATDYFNGIGTAEDAARVIQSRVSIYVSERSR